MSTETSSEAIDILHFMVVQTPNNVDAKTNKRSYIQDSYIDEYGNIKLTSILSSYSPSEIATLVYNYVFCQPEEKQRSSYLVGDVLNTLNSFSPVCDLDPDSTINRYTYNTNDTLNLLEKHAYYKYGDNYVIFPDDISLLDNLGSYKMHLPRIIKLFDVHQKKYEPSKIFDQLKDILGNDLHHMVFSEKDRSSVTDAKRTLFDALYKLYILRRLTSVDLQPIIKAIQAIHVLEALAINNLLDYLKPLDPAQYTAEQTRLLDVLKTLIPETLNWKQNNSVTKYLIIKSHTDFNLYYSAIPVIHPIFARLCEYRKPFNKIKPLGIGYLKVVKKWLIGYQASDISYIDNVLIGEEKLRVNKHLEKIEQSFSSTSETSQNVTKDTQTTERFELKQEIERQIKSDLNVNVNSNLQYKPNQMILVNLSGGLAYNRSTSDVDKMANNYSREVVDKAVTQIQSRTTSARSTIQTFETEETNTHNLSNKTGHQHISGIYRWVDKKYRAQLYNYGKRLMFEFVIPEPAAFFVDARLKAYSNQLNLPLPPEQPNYEQVQLKTSDGKKLEPTLITESELNYLKGIYDLSEFKLPVQSKKLEFINQSTGENYFNKGGLVDDSWSANTYSCNLDAKGYFLDKLIVEGRAYFYTANEVIVDPTIADAVINTIVFSLNGQELYRDANNSIQFFFFNPKEITPSTKLLINSTDNTLTIGLRDGNFYEFSIRGEFSVDPNTILEIQNAIYNKILSIETKKIEEKNNNLEQIYESELARYNNTLDQIQASAINDLLQGESEAFNKNIILTELKKHCLTLLTKEYDDIDSDNVTSTLDAISEANVDYLKTKPKLDRTTTPPKFSFETTPELNGKFPAINIENAKTKARYVQFLEQAFEWQQMAYIFYPYYWAAEPKWISLLSRQDYADPNFTAFLQAGSVKVVLAVTPAYDSAVLHYLATREPWEGGQAPVIGDPLYIPIYEELRKQQDDLFNAKAEGDSWTFSLPTSLVYLQDSSSELPIFPENVAPTP